MPTYNFSCRNCKLVTEEFYQMSKKPEALVCPNCGEIADSVVLGGQGFHLHGHGWAFDRYAGKSNFGFMGDKDNE